MILTQVHHQFHQACKLRTPRWAAAIQASKRGMGDPRKLIDACVNAHAGIAETAAEAESRRVLREVKRLSRKGRWRRSLALEELKKRHGFGSERCGRWLRRLRRLCNGNAFLAADVRNYFKIFSEPPAVTRDRGKIVIGDNDFIIENTGCAEHFILCHGQDEPMFVSTLETTMEMVLRTYSLELIDKMFRG